MIAEATVHKQARISEGIHHNSQSARSLRRITLDEYHRLICQGFFSPEERLELIEGFLIAMSPVHPPHAYATAHITEEFIHLLGRQVSVRSQLPITLPTEGSEPEPDFLVAERAEYIDSHPGPSDILLVGEVSDSTLNFDRTTKLSIYARSGIVEYWILNLVDKQLEIYREPELSADGAEGTYRVKLTREPSESVSLLAFPDIKISLKEIFPY